jgi:hypothetical protein
MKKTLLFLAIALWGINFTVAAEAPVTYKPMPMVKPMSMVHDNLKPQSECFIPLAAALFEGICAAFGISTTAAAGGVAVGTVAGTVAEASAVGFLGSAEIGLASGLVIEGGFVTTVATGTVATADLTVPLLFSITATGFSITTWNMYEDQKFRYGSAGNVPSLSNQIRNADLINNTFAMQFVADLQSKGYQVISAGGKPVQIAIWYSEYTAYIFRLSDNTWIRVGCEGHQIENPRLVPPATKQNLQHIITKQANWSKGLDKVENALSAYMAGTATAGQIALLEKFQKGDCIGSEDCESLKKQLPHSSMNIEEIIRKANSGEQLSLEEQSSLFFTPGWEEKIINSSSLSRLKELSQIHEEKNLLEKIENGKTYPTGKVFKYVLITSRFSDNHGQQPEIKQGIRLGLKNLLHRDIQKDCPREWIKGGGFIKLEQDHILVYDKSIEFGEIPGFYWAMMEEEFSRIFPGKRVVYDKL